MTKPRLFLSMLSSVAMVFSMLSTNVVLAEEPSDSGDTLPTSYPEGVTVDQDANGNYVAHFVYVDTDATSVSVTGNFQWYSKTDPVIAAYPDTADATGAIIYGVDEYNASTNKDDLFNTGYGINSDSKSYPMVDKGDGRFELDLILPGNQYYYDYVVERGEGVQTIQDPANPAPGNALSGSDAGHSLFYVGDASNTAAGQEYIYPRTDGLVGSYSFVPYTATDGTTQYLGVYLPYGYNTSTVYKTLYVSHGGGGNEAEWMTIGSLPNIMDNLIAEGAVEPTVVVTMNNTYFGWNYDTIADNFENYIFPYMEENYSVSTDVTNRALCGLSMGALTTGTMMFQHTNLFQYYGCFSGTADPLSATDLDLLQTKGIYLTGGNVDMAIQYTAGSEDSAFNRGKTVRAHNYLDSINMDHAYDLKYGAHDWAVWRDALTTYAGNYIWTQALDTVSDVNGTLTVDGDDWGPAVSKVVIELDRPIKGDIQDLKVIEQKESTNWGDGSVYIASAERTVKAAYVSDENGEAVSADTPSLYITIEMGISPSEGSSFRYDLLTGSNKWVDPYTLNVTGLVTLVDGNTANLDASRDYDVANGNDYISPEADKFDVTGSFTGSDGIVMPYGLYTPAEDGKTNTLVIWLHGAGEGAGAAGGFNNDNYVDLLGNKVTALVSDEFQEILDGAYILTPQAQTMWMDGGDGSYQNGELGSMYRETLMELIENIVDNNPDIDQNKVIIGGCSNGGYMTMEMILNYPDYFYKAYPICEAFYDTNVTDEQINALANSGMGIWFTYSADDTTVDPTLTTIPTSQRLIDAGAEVHISSYEHVVDLSGRFTDDAGNPYMYSGHWSWIYFFNNVNVDDADSSLNEWVWFTLDPNASYTIIKGDGQTVTKGDSAQFVSDAPFAKFDKVQVDGVDVDASNYTAVSGSTDITLSATFIESLSAGDHTIAIVSTDGVANGTFKVANKKPTSPSTDSNKTKTPTTADRTNIPAMGFVFLVGMLVAVLVANKRRKYSK